MNNRDLTPKVHKATHDEYFNMLVKKLNNQKTYEDMKVITIDLLTKVEYLKKSKVEKKARNLNLKKNLANLVKAIMIRERTVWD